MPQTALRLYEALDALVAEAEATKTNLADLFPLSDLTREIKNAKQVLAENRLEGPL